MSDIGRWAVIPAVPALLAVLWGIPQPATVQRQAVRAGAVRQHAGPHQVSGGYPYAMAPCEFGPAGGRDCVNPRRRGDTYDWGYPGAGGFRAGDPWGYEYRNCTSYVAWQLSRAGVKPVLFSDLGNATAWIASVAGESGVIVNRAPAPGAVAVWAVAGGVGHVAWVDSVRAVGGRTSVTVSDYNYAGTGRFDTHEVAVPPTCYIHFPRVPRGSKPISYYR